MKNFEKYQETHQSALEKSKETGKTPAAAKPSNLKNIQTLDPKP
jgi:hypothetical protein